MGRSPCCDKNGLKKGPWTPEEDTKLTHYIRAHGPGNWRTLPKNAGLDRCGKSCRLRWTNYLRPDIKRGRFSFDEEETIIQLHSVLGNKWSAIASRLPGRTDNEIKNYWNTHVRKRLLRTGIDPVTHSPRLDFPDLSSMINLVQLQTLLNVQKRLVEMNNYQVQIQPNQFENFVDPRITFLHENDNHQLVGPTDDLRRGVDAANDYGIINPCQMTRAELSDNNSSFQSHNSVLSTPLNSGFVAEDEMDSFCSDLLKFEIPEGLNFDDFIM